MQLTTMYSLKNTLNKITVSGEDNLSMRWLASIPWNR